MERIADFRKDDLIVNSGGLVREGFSDLQDNDVNTQRFCLVSFLFVAQH